jgi:hypothetical protein
MFIMVTVLGACDSISMPEGESVGELESPTEVRDRAQGKLFGDIYLLGGPVESETGGDTGIGVNSYLWRASLDTMSFMPLESADPFGGTILTDWYTPAETPSERFKVNVYILGSDLRADAVRATVFRQERDAAGQWVDAAVDTHTATDLENAILTRARQMRIAEAS